SLIILSNAFAFHPLGFSIRWEIVFAINLFGCGSRCGIAKNHFVFSLRFPFRCKYLFKKLCCVFYPLSG
ncbi:hypothetical protein L0337_10265, partial [candidate division KSB1 bacterium]|nr:hypothetical protein [candidate division KSB1 bacterium]